jgi:hypothetical protein
MPSLSDDAQGAFITLDFETWFPYFFWISTWQKDESYPDGFRYKLMSARNTVSDEFDAVLVHQRKNGDKKAMKAWSGPVGEAGLNELRRIAAKCEEAFDIEFQEQDLSGAKSEEEFALKTEEFGWHSANC